MFIVFEGLDQSGKQTQAERLRDWLRLEGGPNASRFSEDHSPYGTAFPACPNSVVRFSYER